MTLSNCPHSSDGWCLECVKTLHDELNATQTVLKEIAEDKNCPYEYVRVGNSGPIYCLYGTSSISAYHALLGISNKRLEISRKEAESLHEKIISISGV